MTLDLFDYAVNIISNTASNHAIQQYFQQYCCLIKILTIQKSEIIQNHIYLACLEINPGPVHV